MLTFYHFLKNAATTYSEKKKIKIKIRFNPPTPPLNTDIFEGFTKASVCDLILLDDTYLTFLMTAFLSPWMEAFVK